MLALLGGRRVALGREGRPDVAVGAHVAQAQALLVGQLHVELEQLAFQVLGGVGLALGVDRVFIARVGNGAGQLHVVAVALGPVGQGIETMIVGTAIHRRGVGLLMVVAAVAVLDHGAGVAPVLQQVRGVLGFGVHGAAETAVAGLGRVRALFHFHPPDQFRLDENHSLLVALEAALGGAVDGDRHVLGVPQAPDVDGLAAGFQRAAEADAGQGVDQADHVVGLVAIDFRLVQGRAADTGGVDLGAVADHAHGPQLQGRAAADAGFGGAHDVGVVDLQQIERAALEQAADRLFGAEVPLQGRCLGVAQQLLIEQQLDLRLLGDLTQGRGQGLRRQLEMQRPGLDLQAEGQAGGEQGWAGTD